MAMLSDRSGNSTGVPSALGGTAVRALLRGWLLDEQGDQTDTVLIEELGICRGQARIDLAVVNGLLHGYEIKSDRDNLSRLATQSQVYNKVLDRATLVVSERHLTTALRTIPKWWSVILIIVNPTGTEFRVLRRGRKNPSRDPRALVELLWYEKSIALLAERNAVRGIIGKPRRVLWDRICERFEVEEIAIAVRAQLKARSATRDPQPPL